MNPGGCAEPPGFLRVYVLRSLGNSHTRLTEAMNG